MILNKEIWKDSKIMIGYEVSNQGNVRKKGKTQNRKLQDNGNGYKIVSKRKNGKLKQYYVHILVANEFCENPNNYKEINHINGQKDCNIYTNLEYCTRSENLIHAIKLGLKRRTTPLQQKTARENLKKITHVSRKKANETRMKNYYKLPLEERKRRQRQMIEPLKKKVSQYDLNNSYIRTFNSIKEAEKETNIFASNIGLCCRNGIKQAGGYVWRYADE